MNTRTLKLLVLAVRMLLIVSPLLLITTASAFENSNDGGQSVLTDLVVIPDAFSVPKSLRFSGYTWDVKSGNGLGPGPNNWSENNAWVDANGYLHLRITKSGSTCYSSEITSQQRFSFGKYQWWVISRLDYLDRDVVLGLFTYDDNGTDYRNEIDVEYARWGNAAAKPGNFTVWPARRLTACTSGWTFSPQGACTLPFPVALNGTYTTQRFTWRTSSIYFQALHGHRNDNSYPIKVANYAPGNYLSAIPQRSLKVHMNLWLSNGRCRSDITTPIEVVIRSFTYTP